MEKNLDDKAVKKQLSKVQDAINAIFKKKPAVMRPPFGSFNENTRKLVKQVGLKAIAMWNLDTQDWNRPDSTAEHTNSFKFLKKFISNPAKNSYIVLLHDFRPGELDELLYGKNENIAKWAQAQGFEIVGLSKCLGLKSPWLS